MKRSIAVIAATLVMITTPAIASPVDEYVLSHNMHRAAAGAAEITGEPEIAKNSYTYKVTENVHVMFNMKEDDLASFCCICLDESGVSEFLAQCVTAFYSLGGLTEYTYCHDPILTDFLAARSGNPVGKDTTVPGFLFGIEKKPFGYTFVLVKVK